MGKRGPKATPDEILKARGSRQIERRQKPQPIIPARRRAPRDTIISEQMMLSGIPGYDPTAGANSYRFSYDAASAAVRFFHERLTLVTGQEPGTPFILLPWQQAIIGNLFGWKRNVDGYRRYRECLIYVAKKNGKTEFAAGILLLVLSTEARTGIQCYSVAAAHKQASVVFAPAVQMIRNDPGLSESLTIYGATAGSMNKALVSNDYPMSTFKCLASDADTVDGLNPHLNLIDEVHRFPDGEVISVLVKSTAARKEPLTIYTTTADYDRVSPCNDLIARARQVRDNRGDPLRPGYEPYFLPVIYECSKDDDWTDPVVWANANPSLGVTVTGDFLRVECEKAKANPADRNQFLRLHLNIVTSSETSWLDMREWDDCGAPVNEEVLRGFDCWAGIDLSTTEDITACVYVFPVDGVFWLVPRFWCPEENAAEREKLDRVPYLSWARDGLLSLTPGNVVDYAYIRKQLDSDRTMWNIREIAYDRWNSSQLIAEMQQDGYEVVQFGQGFASMSSPTKDFGADVKAGKLRHGGHPVLRWMASNAQIQSDAAENIKIVKKDRRSRVDGIIAAIMGRARAALKSRESAWDGSIDFL